MKKYSIISLLILTAIAGILLFGSSSAEIRCPVLQYRMDRLYFPVGEEADIYRDHLFVIYRGDSLAYKGLIENSLPGVSYSYPTGNAFDSLDEQPLTAVIETAAIDSASPITIGISEFPFVSGIRFLPDLFPTDSSLGDSVPPRTASGNELVIRKFDTYTEMIIAFESGELDAMLAYRRYDALGAREKSISAPAPYIAAIIPDLTKSSNDRGLLTTSLYYRFNPEMPELVFNGDDIIPYDCLYPADSGCTRIFGYDPEKGRLLINLLEKHPDKLTINVNDTKLIKMAEYFADILSRDKIRTGVQYNGDKYDINLTFIPLEFNDSATGMNYALDLLGIDDKSDKPARETAKIIGNYIELGRLANNTSGREYYYNLADRGFKEDIGLFPLFRPTLYLTARDVLKGASFDSDGFIDLHCLYLVKSLNPRTEWNR